MKTRFKNEPTSSITHLVGAALSIMGLIVLILLGAFKGTVWHVVGFTIFGVGLVLLYSASTLYHFFNMETKTKEIFKIIDHSMIYVLIAATYTPICLTILRGAFGWTILGIVWTIAIIGIILKSLGFLKSGVFSTIIYLLMGWVIVIAVFPLLKIVHLSGFLWLLAGGIFYTVGAVFYQYDELGSHTKLWGPHETFHIFVIFGSIMHYIFIIKYLI